MAFTTISGSGATDATSYIGTAGIDTLLLQNSTGTAFVGARASSDTITIQNFTALQSGVTVKGGQGTDTIGQAGNTNLDASFFNGNKNNDTFNFGTATSTTVYGGQANDQITVTNATSSIVNGNKNVDTLTITTASGASIFGGQGSDTVNVTTVSASKVQGDLDNDALNLNGTISNSTLNGNGGNDTITANAGVNSFSGSTVYGGAGNDTLTVAGVAQNTTTNLTFSGDNGNDAVTTAAGDDVLLGGAGTDTLAGNSGSDTLTGGTEADTFAIGTNLVDSVNNAVNVDTITDVSTVQGDSITGLSIANLELQAAVTDLTDARDATTVTAGQAVVTSTLALADGATTDLGSAAANTNIILFSTNFTDEADLQTNVRAGLEASNAFGAGDAILAVYDDSVNSYLVQISTAAGVADNAEWADGVVTRLATFNGVGDATSLTAASGVWGAIVA